jgi:hypothetical protein
MRAKQRKSTDELISILDEQWDSWLDELREQKGCMHIVLHAGMYLSDYVMGNI